MLLQRLNLLAKPTTSHSPTKHRAKSAPKKVTENHYKVHRPSTKSTVSRADNSTERLSRLLNETSYTEEEIKEASSDHVTVSAASKKHSLPELVKSITPDESASKMPDRLRPAESGEAKVEKATVSVADFAASQTNKSHLIDARTSDMTNSSNVLSPTRMTSLVKPTEESAVPELILSLITEDSRNVSSNTSDSLLGPPSGTVTGSDIGSVSGPPSGPLSGSDSGVVFNSPSPLPGVPIQLSKFTEDTGQKPGGESTLLGQRLIGEDPGCTNSEIIQNMTLRGGIGAGRFKDRGKMDDFRQCIKICCIAKRCDLAFMLRNNCFSVECVNEELCEAIPVRKMSKHPPVLSYIYARSVAKRQAERPEDFARTDYSFFHLVRRTMGVVIDNSPALLLRKRSASWVNDSTIPRLRLKIPNR